MKFQVQLIPPDEFCYLYLVKHCFGTDTEVMMGRLRDKPGDLEYMQSYFVEYDSIDKAKEDLLSFNFEMNECYDVKIIQLTDVVKYQFCRTKENPKIHLEEVT